MKPTRGRHQKSCVEHEGMVGLLDTRAKLAAGVGGMKTSTVKKAIRIAVATVIASLFVYCLPGF